MLAIQLTTGEALGSHQGWGHDGGLSYGLFLVAIGTHGWRKLIPRFGGVT